ncbi:MAG: hypothetical protein ACLFV6_10095 [Spirulinaceae cyanobacterium]
MVLKIEPLNARQHIRSGFSCGKDSLIQRARSRLYKYPQSRHPVMKLSVFIRDLRPE